MKKRRLTHFAKGMIAVVVTALIVMSAVFLKPVFFPTENPSAPELSSTPYTVQTVVPISEQQIEYETNKAVNPEYFGRILFDSGIVDQNVVQTTDNEKYLHYSWDLQESTRGAAYMDYRNTLDDQNLIFYGHYVYYDTDKMFTPLEKLMDADQYEANKMIELRLGPDEVRRYVVTDVFYYVLDTDNVKYYKQNYDADTFQTFYANVKAADFYETGETLSELDRWISLQTCVRNHDELREIVLAKQVS